MVSKKLGYPSIEDIELSVRDIVVNVNCLGVDNCLDYFKILNNGIEEKIKRAIDYCRKENCVEDFKDKIIINYCIHCSKNNQKENLEKSNVWEVANNLYNRLYS